MILLDPAVPAADILAAALTGPYRLRCPAPGDGGIPGLAEAIAGAGEGSGSVHLFCHGEPGALLLAGGRIDLHAIARNPGPVSRLRHALDGRPLVLYGCAVGRGEVGRRFVESLSLVLATPVLASSTPTGGRLHGGDWHLDVAAGAATDGFPDLVDPVRGAGWPGLLAGSTNVTTTAGDTGAGSVRAAAADPTDFQTFVFQDLGSAASITLGGPLTFTHAAAVS